MQNNQITLVKPASE